MLASSNINGPLNIIRLTGNVGGVSKVIYLFCDIHMPFGSETKCDGSKRAVDIDKYLKDMFKKLTKGEKQYDFFMEISPSVLNDKMRKTNKIYIEKSIDFVSKVFNVEKNRVKVSKGYPKVRFHYVDVRDYLINNLNDMQRMNQVMREMTDNGRLDGDSLDRIGKLIDYDRVIIDFIYGLFYGKGISDDIKVNLLDPMEEGKNVRTFKIEKIVGKIKGKYVDKGNEEKIGHIIGNELRRYFKEFNDVSGKFIGLIGDIKLRIGVGDDELYVRDGKVDYGFPYDETLELLYKLNKLMIEYERAELRLFGLITDVFFVRRFVDKPYITNGIAYVGLSHAVNYIYMLVKYFGFEIKNYSYLGVDLDVMMGKIMGADGPDGLLQYFMPGKLKQCSSIKGFPGKFE